MLGIELGELRATWTTDQKERQRIWTQYRDGSNVNMLASIHGMSHDEIDAILRDPASRPVSPRVAAMRAEMAPYMEEARKVIKDWPPPTEEQLRVIGEVIHGVHLPPHGGGEGS